MHNVILVDRSRLPIEVRGFFPRHRGGKYESYGFPNLIANLNKPGIGGNSDNRGFIDRRERTERSKVQETCWPLHSDFFQISQYW